MARRHYKTIVDHLTTDPETAVELSARLSDDVLAHLRAAIDDEVRTRAKDNGDPDAIIADAFEAGFGRDNLGTNPWIEGRYIVCPGAIVAKSRTNHTCRFVSVNDTWIWDSPELLREDKRSLPGTVDGFRAVALLPVLENLALDVVSGRARSGAHRVERVTSFVVRRSALVEVSQRVVSAAGMQ